MENYYLPPKIIFFKIFYFFILALLCIYALFVVLSVFLVYFVCFKCICMFLCLDALKSNVLCLLCYLECF